MAALPLPAGLVFDTTFARRMNSSAASMVAALMVETRLRNSAKLGSSLETVVKDYRVLSLPYVFDDNAQADRILQGQVGDKLLARLEPHGMMGLGFGANFERNIGSRKPVNARSSIRSRPTRGRRLAQSSEERASAAR